MAQVATVTRHLPGDRGGPQHHAVMDAGHHRGRHFGIAKVDGIGLEAFGVFLGDEFSGQFAALKAGM